MSRKSVGLLFCLTPVSIGLLFVLQLAVQQKASAQERESNQSVAARVDGQPITIRRLEHELKRVQRTRTVRKPAQATFRAQMLDQVVNQLLVLGYLEYTEQGAKAVEVDLAIENLQQRIKQRSETLDQYLQNQGLSQAELRQKIAWQIGWSRYLNRYLTEKNYRSYFDEHRREFDGTQLHVAHVLLRVSKQASADMVQRQEQAIKAIREQIVSGKITFSAAAQKFSQSPTGEQGGDLGWIERREPMSEEFSAAAFRLKPGEISLPIRSAFGFHLITCREIKPGKKEWQEVREVLREAITKYLFQWTAQQQHKRVGLEFTGAWPYFHPQSGDLVTSPVSLKTRPGPKRP